MRYRFATLDDVPLLCRMNRQLVSDEGHRSRAQSDAWFEARMRGFLTGDYTAVLFELEGETVAYALYVDHPDHADTIYLRQIWVDRARRREGIGREAMRLLETEIWPPEVRLTVGVLAANRAALAFHKAIGFQDYALELETPASARSPRSGSRSDVDGAPSQAGERGFRSPGWPSTPFCPKLEAMVQCLRSYHLSISQHTSTNLS